MGFPGGSGVKNLPANTGDSGSISGSGRSTGEGNGNPLQYFRLGSPMDRGAWWAAVPGVTRVGHNLVTKPPHHHCGLDKLAEKEHCKLTPKDGCSHLSASHIFLA